MRIRFALVAIWAFITVLAVSGVELANEVEFDADVTLLQHQQWAELVESLEAAMAAEFGPGEDSFVQIDSVTEQEHEQEEFAAPRAPTKTTKASPKTTTAKKSTTAAPQPAKSVAERLSPAEHQAKWAAFKAANPKKKYKTPQAEQAAFSQFVANRQKLVTLNDGAANAINPKPFKSSGPLADMSTEQFRAKFLRVRRGTDRGGRLPNREEAAAVKRFGPTPTSKSTAAKSTAKQPARARFAQTMMEVDAEADEAAEAEVEDDADADAEVDSDADLEVDFEHLSETDLDAEADAEAEVSAALDADAEETDAQLMEVRGAPKGRTAGAAGRGAGAAGTAAGAAGTAAGAAGRAAGAAGTAAGAAGTAAGAAGHAAGAAGTAAGAAGHAAGVAGRLAGAAGTAAGAAGTAAGAAGTAAGAAGTVAGAAGTVAGAAGTVAGAAGTVAGAAGTVAGAAGHVSGASGTVAGASGNTITGVIVSPTVQREIDMFQPFKGPVFLNPADTTPERRICRAVANIWFRRYAHTSAQKLWQFGIKLFGGGSKQFFDDPMKLCVTDWHKWVEKLHPEQKYIRNAFEELRDRPAGTSFVNPFVATNDVPRDQETCGSCWAQAAVGSFEVALKKAGKYTGPLSIQQVLDCVKTKESNGCSGGTPQDALDWLSKNDVSLESDYPYIGQTGVCRKTAAAAKKVPRSSGWMFATKSCTKGKCDDQYGFETELLFAVKSDGPFIAYVDASNWQYYGGGIFPHSKCSSTADAGNHVVQLLGYGQQDGVPYWLVKNSWGSSWGENGYIRLAMGVNACGITNFVGRATLASSSVSFI